MNMQNGLTLKEVFKYIVTFFGLLLGVFLVYKMFFYLIPFILAFAISILIDPMVSFLTKRLKLSRSLASIVSVFLILCFLGLIIVFIISRLIAEIVNLSVTLPKYTAEFYSNLNGLIKKGTDIYLGLPAEVSKSLGSATQNLSSYLVKAINSFLAGIYNAAASIPNMIVFILVTILSTYFFCSDKTKVYNFFASRLPNKLIEGIQNIKGNMFQALFGYIRAQLILMSITFSELYTSFLIIGIKHPLILALIASFVDALPILGVGSVLIPSSIYFLLTGSFRTGISILIIYVIVLVVRQTIEPKILSQQIGMHPLLTLLAMYTGLQLLGVAGLIFGPITVLLMKNILSGVFKNKTARDLFLKNKS
jgi:sporulation integral membrane protein YtvI